MNVIAFTDKSETMTVGIRQKHAKKPYGSKHQIILPKENRISQLILRGLHNHKQMGSEYVLSELRKKYWIIKGISLIKQVANRYI